MEKKFEVDAQTFIGGWYMSEEICDQILDLYNNNKSLHEPGVVGTDIINEDGKVTSRPHIDAEAKKCTQLRVLKNAQQLSLYNIHLQAILDSYKQKYEWADQVKYYKIEYHDPHLKSIFLNKSLKKIKKIKKISSNKIKTFDIVVLMTDHDVFDYKMLLRNSKLIIDCRGRYKVNNKVIRA